MINLEPHVGTVIIGKVVLKPCVEHMTDYPIVYIIDNELYYLDKKYWGGYTYTFKKVADTLHALSNNPPIQTSSLDGVSIYAIDGNIDGTSITLPLYSPSNFKADTLNHYIENYEYLKFTIEKVESKTSTIARKIYAASFNYSHELKVGDQIYDKMSNKYGEIVAIKSGGVHISIIVEGQRRVRHINSILTPAAKRRITLRNISNDL